MHGSYEATELGHENEALQDLTSGVSFSIKIGGAEGGRRRVVWGKRVVWVNDDERELSQKMTIDIEYIFFLNARRVCMHPMTRFFFLSHSQLTT